MLSLFTIVDGILQCTFALNSFLAKCHFVLQNDNILWLVVIGLWCSTTPILFRCAVVLSFYYNTVICTQGTYKELALEVYLYVQAMRWRCRISILNWQVCGSHVFQCISLGFSGFIFRWLERYYPMVSIILF